MRDIQFHYPQVGVLPRPPFQPVGKFLFVGRIFAFGRMPPADAMGIGHSLEHPGIHPPVGQHDKDSARIRLALVEHAGKSARGSDLPHQRANLEMRGQPRFHELQPIWGGA